MNNTVTGISDKIPEYLKDLYSSLLGEVYWTSSFQSPSFYLADFSPTALETSVTDKKGYFVVHNPTKGTKIFATVKSDETGEEFFWLVDLPQKEEKLVLSDSNLLTIPTNLQ
jgi:hypothetical protein